MKTLQTETPFTAVRWTIQASGEPPSGPMFPVLRSAHAGKGAKVGVSHAEALRRDLRRAFGIEQLQLKDAQRAGKTMQT